MAKQRYAYTTRRQREELEAMVAVMLRFFNLGYLINIYYEDPPSDPDWIASVEYSRGREEAALCVRRDFYDKNRAERLQIVAHEIAHVMNYRVLDTAQTIIDQLPEGPARNLAKELYERESEFFIEGLAAAIMRYSDDLLAEVDRKLAEKAAARKGAKGNGA